MKKVFGVVEGDYGWAFALPTCFSSGLPSLRDEALEYSTTILDSSSTSPNVKEHESKTPFSYHVNVSITLIGNLDIIF